jgi:tRNA threonylcarbamoyladenosine biosynthesis protein TsaE
MNLIYNIDQIADVARQFWKEAGSFKVFAIHGPMGAGKTTFVHALCEVKGVRDHVTSPTFSLINEYRYPSGDENGKIFHIDLYRLDDEEEAEKAGIEDCLYSDAICLVEWPEKAPGIFPENTAQVWLQPVDATQRQLKLLFP